MPISNELIILMANGTNLNEQGKGGWGRGGTTKFTNYRQPMGMA